MEQMQMPDFPCLPGFNFNYNIGRTRFNKNHVFDRINKNVYYLLEKQDTTFNDYPALYAWGEIPPNPTWLTYDRQRLKFNAYFQESVYGRKEPYRIRLVNISFFLEDGTIKISEPAITNSGLEQGILVKRQRIPLPNPVQYRYYDILDLNVGMEPMIFGRVYKIINCDDFTRRFLNRMGIPVPDPLTPPKNLDFEPTKPFKVKQRPTTPDKFFKYDGKILRFFGYWDDSDSPHGYIHDLEIYFYLSDDTMQVIDHSPAEYGSNSKTTLVKKIRIPKFFTNIEPVGDSDPTTVLNVLGDDKVNYYISDHAHPEKSSENYYRENDLAIGARINIFGRKVIITHLDKYTEEYYRKKYGLDDFTRLERPGRRISENKDHDEHVPPYNGFGEYEDTLGNCFTLIPKRPKVITDKFFTYENQENDKRILRFGAKMISDIPGNQSRRFIMSVFLIDSTILIVEGASKKAGRTKNIFQKRMRFKLPGQNIFSSKKPQYYEPQDFFVGAILNLMGFKFEVETADEFTFNYMEKHCKEFPKSDKNLVMTKIRETLGSDYPNFIKNYSPIKSDNHPPVITIENLREGLHKYMGDRITEHEVQTVARHFSHSEKKDFCPREYLRSVVHIELIRNLFNDLERLDEDIRYLDRTNSGHLTRAQLYTTLYANRIPLPKELINLILDRIKTNEEGLLDYRDLLKFLNVKEDPPAPVIPTNVKALYWKKEDTPNDYKIIDWSSFLQDLNLEEEKKEEEKPVMELCVKKDDEN